MTISKFGLKVGWRRYGWKRWSRFLAASALQHFNARIRLGQLDLLIF